MTVSSANLRQGPGVGAAVAGVAYAGDSFRILAVHTGGGWYEITWEARSVWIAAVAGELRGDCASQPVSNVPFQGNSGGAVTPTTELGDDSGSDGNSGGNDDNSGSDDSPEDNELETDEPD